jgi:hypothetical protein
MQVLVVAILKALFAIDAALRFNHSNDIEFFQGSLLLI